MRKTNYVCNFLLKRSYQGRCNSAVVNYLTQKDVCFEYINQINRWQSKNLHKNQFTDQRLQILGRRRAIKTTLIRENSGSVTNKIDFPDVLDGNLKKQNAHFFT
jgi:hypothetical protein